MNHSTNNRKQNTQKITLYGLMLAAALILSYVEAQIPAFFAVPGMKLGLTNIIVVFALYRLGSGSAMAVNLLRIALASLLFGGMAAFLYSAAGGFLSTTVMILLKKTGKFSTPVVSAAGGICHNIGQILVAMLWMNTVSIGWYLLILWFTGMFSGLLIGLIGAELNRRLPGITKEGSH